MKKLSYLCILFIILLSCQTAPDKSVIDLSGEWKFKLDPEDVGIKEQWFKQTLPDHIKLPGSLQEQGFGNDVDANTQWTGGVADSAFFKDPAYEKYRRKDNFKVPFWLQPDKHYVGVAWYQKEIEIPKDWEGKYVELSLERTHWETSLYINGKEAGTDNALQTPHRYMIPSLGKMILTIRVDNKLNIPVGVSAHSVSDQTQSNWNGIVGNISVIAKPALYINNVQVYPNVKERKAKVVIDLAGASSTGEAELILTGNSFNSDKNLTIKTVSSKINCNDKKQVEMEVYMGKDMLTWSEFEPNLYRLNVELISGEGKDIRDVTFGMREIRAQGRRFYVNDVPTFLRGTLECAIFPLTGYASMDPAYWEKIYKRCKEYGLNHVRFHSWCPPKVAFEIADKEGMYLQVECGVWANVNIGDGEYIDQWIYEEGDRILKEFGNHPSFCLMTHGNEPSGANQVTYLSGLIDHWKSTDPRKVYSTSGGWPYAENADYWNAPDPRIQGWGQNLKSVINAEPPRTDYDFEAIIKTKNMPTISHEIGDWCAYPNFKEISKYTGVLKAKNFEIFKETLEENHLGDLADQFLYASGRLQTLCYKADIEAALRTPEFAGFQLLALLDFPGQGTALVGVLDAFWDSKGYVSSKEFRTFCNKTVPLARMHKMIWTNKETFKASVEVSHFDKQAIENATVRWVIQDISGNKQAQGETHKNLPVNNCIKITDIEYDLSSVKEPSKMELVISIDGTDAVNKWSFWVYPEEEPVINNKPFITSSYNEAIARANKGENVLYYIKKGLIRPDKGGDIAVGFSSIFWNTAWTLKQEPHEFGVFCDPKHPVFSLFPNDGHSDYQWWDIVTSCSAMDMSGFPASYRPVIHLIDDWFTNRKLGILFETKVGKGKMMVCSIDPDQNITNRPSTRQLKLSIEKYMASEQFNPTEELKLSIIRELTK